MLYPELRWPPESSPGQSDDGHRIETLREFDRVVGLVEDLIPRVEIAEPGLAFVPVGGAVAYYGGEIGILEAVDVALEGRCRLGIADGPFAARCAAEKASNGPHLVEDTARFLADLSIENLGSEELVETFRWLGVTTLGHLADMPREAIASRFGDLGLTAHRLAAGEDRALNPRNIPPEYAVEWEDKDEPLQGADQAAFVTRSLAVELLEGLTRIGAAPYRVVVEVEAADAAVRERTWRSVDPFTDKILAERVWWQLRAWMESPGGVPGGVIRIRLDPSDMSGEGRQLPLLEQVGSSWQEVEAGRHDSERALSRAQALVGPDQVLSAAPRGGRLPHERVSWYPWGEPVPLTPQDAPWPGQTPQPHPAMVSQRPPLMEVEWDGGMPTRIRLGARWESVLSWSGPWRLVGKWWQGEGSSDRYQIVTSAGAVLCLVQDGKAYLAAVYD